MTEGKEQMEKLLLNVSEVSIVAGKNPRNIDISGGILYIT